MAQQSKQARYFASLPSPILFSQNTSSGASQPLQFSTSARPVSASAAQPVHLGQTIQGQPKEQTFTELNCHSHYIWVRGLQEDNNGQATWLYPPMRLCTGGHLLTESKQAAKGSGSTVWCAWLIETLLSRARAPQATAVAGSTREDAESFQLGKDLANSLCILTA